MIEISTNIISQLIEEQFPEWKDLTVKAVENSGWDNRMFKLGDNMVVRLPSSKIYEDKIEKEFFFLPKLSSELSCEIPKPLALGNPSKHYPLKWSVYNWIEGQILFDSEIDMNFVHDLSDFIKDLHKINPEGGPKAGKQNFHRGGDLSIYGKQVREALILLKDKINYSKAIDIWERAISSKWEKAPVWVHGDLSPGNILLESGRLKGVIDFGGIGIGDPACDLVIAYNFFDSPLRDVFKNAVNLDRETWNRAKGWALWKAAIVESGMSNTNHIEQNLARFTLEQLVLIDK